jgi:hypothetical protein
MASKIEKTVMHPLKNTWVLYAHLPHDNNWNVDSYKIITEVKFAEQVIALIDCLPEEVVSGCMLFWMRKGINPTWEDKENRSGGCFSYKIPNKSVTSVWRKMSYLLCGETLSKDNVMNNINGITISPKKNFCILKIWLKTCSFQNPSIINYPGGNIISPDGCLFKRHNPEY